ncbi:diacylglycerol kinase family protein [Bacillus sp. CGMCC 1.16607]|uniref:diacylglycerol kinase family protein n=1 Tax=Bacillus sp. CGMCC 1.16607 TaxID=3351842 RepID=UPI00362D417F
MALNDKKRKRKFADTFKFAIEGICCSIFQERNMRIHIIISLLVVFIGYCLSINRTEWMFILFAIGGMLALEMINSAIERVVDLVTDYQFHSLAKQAKDIAAGAVLTYAFLSIIIGMIIFIPKIITLF